MRSNRCSSRERLDKVLRLLLAVALTAGGIVLYLKLKGGGDTGTEPAGNPPLTVRYRTDPKAVTAVAKPELEVVNTSKQPVQLGDVTLRYYFTADEGTQYAFGCVDAAVGCTHVFGTVVTRAPAADRYLQVGFTSDAGTLAPGGSTKGIRIQLYRLDHKDVNQVHDRSFDAKLVTYKPSKLVTAYLRGALAWGEEPGGAAAAGPGVAPGQATPPGTVFDNFHYSGAGDPSLRKHGWLIRTGKGGPGIAGTWSPDGISFPADSTAQGGQVLQLQVGTDGTKPNTEQAELSAVGNVFFTGTYAARVYFTDLPSTGKNGDHVNQTFFTDSSEQDPHSELDFEYLPNGGWGAPGPALDTTSWFSLKDGDRVTKRHQTSLKGWHTLIVTAVNGVVAYSVDGKEVYTHQGKHFPREVMTVNFSAWFIGLPFTGPRTWDMKVNWFYHNANQAMSLADVEKTVAGFYESGMNYVNTSAKP